ncbi:hypothetical protein UVI_02059140 [Ustilaginoidea virens]|nr:hypothetical protein UVI_02059140 [Ustilaginoidea virens]
MRSRQGSLESISYDDGADLDDKSRITSWTNSTANTIINYGANEDREYQRLSVIKENGMHVPSSSQIGPLRDGRTPSGDAMSVPKWTINSQRVYSALVKRLTSDAQAEKTLQDSNPAKQGPDDSVPPRQSSLDRAAPQTCSPSTVRCIGTEDDDVFEDKKEAASSRSNLASKMFTDGVECDKIGRTASYKAYPNPTAGDGKGLSPTKISCPELASPKAMPLQAEKHSAFSPSPDNYFFRTTSPYRRTLQRSMKEHQDTEHTHALDTRYLSTLSALSLPTRRPSTLGSERDLRTTYAESFYSFMTDELTTSGGVDDAATPHGAEDGREGVENEPFGVAISTPAGTRNISPASSVDWKRRLSAHEFKSKTPSKKTTSQIGDDPKGGPQLKARHVRENAEIDSPAEMSKIEAAQATPIVPLGEGSANILGPHSARTHCNKAQDANLKSPGAFDENASSFENELARSCGSPQPPPIPYRKRLRAIPSLPIVGCVAAASKSVSCARDIPRMRSLNTIVSAGATAPGGSHAQSLGQENGAKEALTPSDLNADGPATAGGDDYANARTGSGKRQGPSNPPSVPHTPGVVAPVTDGIPGSMKSEWDAQIRGSRRMVDLFLSSRRKAIQGTASRNGSENFPAAFV